MKKLIFMIAIMGMLSASYAQNLSPNDVPPVVSKAFVKSHAKITTIEWTKAGENYKANYVVDSLGRSVTYNVKGKVIETETQISVAALPTPVIKYINENYKDGYVKKSSKITNAKGKTMYSVKIKDLDLMFDVNGKLMPANS